MFWALFVCWCLWAVGRYQDNAVVSRGRQADFCSVSPGVGCP